METLQNSGKSTLNIVILASDNVDLDAIIAIRSAMKDIGISSVIVGNKAGIIKSAQGTNIQPDNELANVASLEYIALFIPGGNGIDLLCNDDGALSFIRDAYKKGKLIAASQGGEKLLAKAAESAKLPDGVFVGEGIITQSLTSDDFLKRLISALLQGQLYHRPDIDLID